MTVAAAIRGRARARPCQICGQQCAYTHFRSGMTVSAPAIKPIRKTMAANVTNITVRVIPSIRPRGLPLGMKQYPENTPPHDRTTPGRIHHRPSRCAPQCCYEQTQRLGPSTAHIPWRSMRQHAAGECIRQQRLRNGGWRGLRAPQYHERASLVSLLHHSPSESFHERGCQCLTLRFRRRISESRNLLHQLQADLLKNTGTNPVGYSRESGFHIGCTRLETIFKNAVSLSSGDMEKMDRRCSLKGKPGWFGSTLIANHASTSARRSAFPNDDFSFVPR